MADQKITRLAELVTPAVGDLFEIVDLDVLTNKKITLANLKTAVDPTPTIETWIVNDLANRGGLTSGGFIANTTALFGAFKLPFKIVVNKLTIRCQAVATPSTLDIAVYSEDGQTKLFEVTTPNLAAATTFYTTVVDSVTLPPGIYYLVAVANGTPVNLAIRTYLGDISTPQGVPAGEPVLSGTKAVAAGTLPDTFDPSTINYAINKLIVARFDT